MTSPTRARRNSTSRRPSPPPPATPDSTTPEALEPPRSPLFQPPEDLPPVPEMTDPGPVLPPWSNNDLPVNAGDPGSPSDTPSTDSPKKAPRLGRAALRGYARKAIEKAGEYLAEALTVAGSIEREARLWVPDEDDVRDMADPVAGLVARRIPAGSAVENPDVRDGLLLAMAVAGYIGKQLNKRAEIRKAFPPIPPDMTAGDVQPEAVPRYE